MGLAVTRGSSASRAGVELTLKLPSGSLDNVHGGSVRRAAGIGREITVEAGTQLSLDWNFLTNDDRDGDFAFVYVSDAADVVWLADPLSTSVESAAVEFARETGFQQFVHTFQEAGQYSFAIGVAEANDELGESAVLIDNLTLDGIGDPGPRFQDIVQTTLDVPLENPLRLRRKFDRDATDFMQLALRVRYDDGFAAFINGEQVASQNAPANLDDRVSATAIRTQSDAARLEDFFIAPSAMHAGENLFAIEGYNHQSDTVDFLIDATLFAIGMPSADASYFYTPTAGGPNVTESSAVTKSPEHVRFSHPSDFYESPFALTLLTGEPNGTIRYTLDGSLPTEETGQEYRQPLLIDSTAIVRATVFRDGAAGMTESATYLFVDDVLQQSAESAAAAGIPSDQIDFAFDPEVIGPDDLFDGKYADTIREDLLSLPSLSLVMNVEDLFGDQGIYINRSDRGDEWERPVAAELIFPGQENGFRVNAGLRIHGVASRRSAKPSFRLHFREQYGAGKLNDALFGESGPTEFNALVLRSSTSETLAQQLHYLRDQTDRRLESAMGNPSVEGNFVHLYLNGFYWGLFNMMERIDPTFAVSRDGGSEEEYDIYTVTDTNEQSLIASMVTQTHGGGSKRWRVKSHRHPRASCERPPT